MWGSCLVSLAARKCFEDVPRQAKEYLVFTCVKGSDFLGFFNRNQNQNMEWVVSPTVKADFFFQKGKYLYYDVYYKP